jgi:hypothetical protein
MILYNDMDAREFLAAASKKKAVVGLLYSVTKDWKRALTKLTGYWSPTIAGLVTRTDSFYKDVSAILDWFQIVLLYNNWNFPRYQVVIVQLKILQRILKSSNSYLCWSNSVLRRRAQWKASSYCLWRSHLLWSPTAVHQPHRPVTLGHSQPDLRLRPFKFPTLDRMEMCGFTPAWAPNRGRSR